MIWIAFLGKLVTFFFLFLTKWYQPFAMQSWSWAFILCNETLLIVIFAWLFQELGLFTFMPPSVSWARCWMSWLFSGCWCVLLPCGSLGDTYQEFFGMTGNCVMWYTFLSLETFHINLCVMIVSDHLTLPLLPLSFSLNFPPVAYIAFCSLEVLSLQVFMLYFMPYNFRFWSSVPLEVPVLVNSWKTHFYICYNIYMI